MFCAYCRLLRRFILFVSLWTSILTSALLAQTPANSGPTTRSLPSISSNKEGSIATRAYVDYLRALELANEGAKSEALHLLAESLRLQLNDNPASALVFELLIEQRANTSLKLQGHTANVTSVSYSADGAKILTASLDHSARIWDASTGAQLTTPLEHESAVSASAFSVDGKRVVTGTAESEVRIWNAATGRPITAPLELHGAVVCVSFSPDGKIIAAGTDEGRLRTWNAITGQPVSPVVLYHEAVYGVSFNRDGSKLLTATGDGKAELLDSRTGARLQPLRHKNIVLSAQFSSDYQTILTASADETARIWNANTGAPTGVTVHHGFAIESATFNGDSSRIVTASLDHTARVWDAKTGLPVTPLLQHPAPVGRASFSPDGRMLVTVSGEGAVRVWDSATGDLLHLPIYGKEKEPYAVFSENGRSLLVTEGTSLKVLDLPPNENPPVWLVDLAEFGAAQAHYNFLLSPDIPKVHALREQLLSSDDNDLWTVFGKWYFADSSQRPISPWSQVSLESYVNLLIARGDRQSLEYAQLLSHSFPSWNAKIDPLLAKLPPNNPQRATTN